MGKQHQEKTTHSTPQQQTAEQMPFFQAKMNNGQNACAGWLSDMESLTKKAAEQYGSDVFPGPVSAQSHTLENNGKWYVWTTQTIMGPKKIFVSIVGLPDHISVRIPGSNYKTYRYGFTCDASGNIQFTRMHNYLNSKNQP